MEEYWLHQPGPSRGRMQMPATPPQKAPRSKKPLNWRKLVLIILITLFALGFIGVVGFFIKRTSDLQKENSRLSNSSESAKALQDETIAAVQKLAIVPQDETPTVATVSDPSKLAGQPFFKDAQVGDSVLVYAKAKKAYLYRSSENKIVNIAPLTLGEEADLE